MAIPTDTVYGLAARVDRPDAWPPSSQLKGRPADLALPVLIGRWRQVPRRWPRLAAQRLDAGRPLLARRRSPWWCRPAPRWDPLLGGDGPDGRPASSRHRGARSLCRSRRPAGGHQCQPPRSNRPAPRRERGGGAPSRPLGGWCDGGTCDGDAVHRGGLHGVARRPASERAGSPGPGWRRRSARTGAQAARGERRPHSTVGVVRIAVGSDHAGFPLKPVLIAHLAGQGHEVADLGRTARSR